MKTFKRVVSLFLTALMVLGSVSAFAVLNDGKERTLVSQVRFYREDSNGEWVETTKVAAGEQIEARIILQSDFIIGAHSLFYAYSKDVFSINTSMQSDSTLITYDADELGGDIYWDSQIQPDINDLIDYHGDSYLDETFLDKYGFIKIAVSEGKTHIFDGVEELYSVYFTVNEDVAADAVGTMFLPAESRMVRDITDPNSVRIPLPTNVAKCFIAEELGVDMARVDGHFPYDSNYWDEDFEVYNVKSPNISAVGLSQGDDQATVDANSTFQYKAGSVYGDADVTIESSYVTPADLVTVNYYVPAYGYNPDTDESLVQWKDAYAYQTGTGARRVWNYDQTAVDSVTAFKGTVPPAPSTYGVLQDIPEGYYFAGWTVYPGAADAAEFDPATGVTTYMSTAPAITDTVTGLANDYSAAQGQRNQIAPEEYESLVADPTIPVMKPLTDENYGTAIYEGDDGLTLDLIALILPIPVETVTVNWKYYEAGTTNEITLDPTEDVVPGSVVTAPTVPEVEGYTFKWYTDAARETEAVAADYTINAETTFYGKYTINTHTVTYNYKSGSDDVLPSTQTDAEYNSAVDITPPAVDGYFIPSGSEPVIAPALLEGNKMPDSDVTVTFNYTQNPLLSWNVNGEALKEGRVAPGTSTDAQAPTATEIDAALEGTGKYFVDWSSHPATMPETDVTVNANLSEEEYTFKFVDNDEFDVTNDTPDKPVGAEDTYSALPVPENIPEGYSFAGYEDVNTGDIYDPIGAGDTPFGDKGDNGKEITLKPVFTVNQYNIIYFDSDEATALATVTDDYGATITEPSVTVTPKEGYTNLNTWTYKTEAGTVLDPAPATVPAQDLKAYPDFSINTYKYVFVDNQQGTTTPDVEAEYGAEISKPVPSKTGWSFAGWFSDEELENEYSFPGNMPALGDGTDGQTMTLYAKWEPADANYTITVYTMNTDGETYTAATPTEAGGTSDDVLTRDAIVAIVGAPSTGFEVNETRSADSFTIAEGANYDLYIDRIAYTYTLELDGGAFESGATDPSGSYVFGAPVATVSDPVKANYNFKGWDASLITEMPAEDVTITAQWKHFTEITIIKDKDDPANVEVLDVEQGETVTPSDAVPVEGYTFVGWATDSDADPDSPAVTKSITAGNDDESTYYPIYKVNTHNVTFIPDAYNTWDGEADETVTWTDGVEPGADGNYVLEVPYETDIDTVAPAISRTGYDFDGWLYDHNPMPDEDVEAIATWTPHTHDIIFVWIDNDGVEHEMTEDSYTDVEFGDTVDETGSEPGEREGWHFIDTWLEETDGIEPVDYEYMPDRDLKFIAQYEKNEYEYTLDLAEGTVADDAEYTASGVYEYEAEIKVPADSDLSKAGYDFGGWVYTNTLTGDEASATDAMPAYDLTVTAQWDKHTYNIEYAMDGGTPQIAATTAQPGDTITLPVWPDEFDKTGSEFNGWKYGTTTYTDTFTVPALENNGDTIVLSALWDVSEVTITFNSKGGSEVEALTGEYNTAVTAPAEPTYAGYDFGGWFENEDYTGSAYVFTTFPATDITLFAKWTPHTYNVVFLQPDEGTTEPAFESKTAYEYKEVNFGEGTQAPENYPEFQYYTAKGWSTAPDGELVDFATWTMPAADKDSDFYFYPVFERDPIKLVIKSTSDADIVKTSETLPVNGYIYNAGEKLNITRLQEQLTVEGPGEIRITPSKGNSICGTGTKIELIDTLTGDVVEAYYLIVAGDVNGDSACNGNDFSIAEAYRNGAAADWRLADKDGATDEQIAENARKREAYKRAADVADANGEVDDIDTALIELVLLKAATFSYDKEEQCITVEEN